MFSVTTCLNRPSIGQNFQLLVASLATYCNKLFINIIECRGIFHVVMLSPCFRHVLNTLSPCAHVVSVLTCCLVLLSPSCAHVIILPCCHVLFVLSPFQHVVLFRPCCYLIMFSPCCHVLVSRHFRGKPTQHDHFSSTEYLRHVK